MTDTKTSRDLVLEAVSRSRHSGEISKAHAFAVRLASLRRRRFNRRCNELVETLAEDLEASPPAFGGETYDLDLEQFEKLLKLLLEYLPKILAIILPLFTSDD